MRKSILGLFFVSLFVVCCSGLLRGQATNPSIISVSVAPTGSCTAGLPNQQVVTTGVQYSCQNGTWGAIGSGSSVSLTTNNTSGPSTLVGSVLNVPVYGSAVSSATSPIYTPTTYVAFGDSISACGTNLTNGNNCYVNHLGYSLNVTPINRSTSGDMAADLIWRVQSTDLPTVAAQPNLFTMMIGTNDANTNGVGPTTWEANYKLFHTAFIYFLGIQTAYQVAGSTATATGTCANDTTYAAITGKKCTANGSTLTFSSFATAGSPLYVFYNVISTDTGMFSCQVDSGTPISATTAPPINFTTVNGHTSSMGYLRFTGVAAGTHTVLCTQTAAGSMSVLSIGSLPALPITALPRWIVGDVPDQLNQNLIAATSAYALDAQADITQAAGDGINVTLAPIANYPSAGLNGTLQATTAAADMNGNTLHPDDVGHLELYAGFNAATKLSVANFIPYTWSPSSNGALYFYSGTVNLGTQSAVASGTTLTVRSYLNTVAGQADIQVIRQNTGAVSDIQFVNSSGGGFRWGMIQDSAADLYDNTNAHRIISLPLNTMPASSYGGNSAGPVLLVVQTPAARKGTFVCTAGGTITISNTNEAVTSDVVISLNTAGGTISTPPAMKTVTAGTGFTVLCGASDTSTYNYNILN